MGVLRGIWIKRAKGGPMDPVDRADVDTERGIAGNADVGGRRTVTVIERERWDAVCAELGATLDPSLRRANVLVEGVVLEDSRGRLLGIGDVAIRIGGETKPCRLMDEQHPGLQDALGPHWGGGAYGTVERGGTIRVGDTVEWLEGSGLE
jgi:MOSC domain-containing protein YiiM